MAFTPAPGEQYTIRRKFFQIFGAGFHIYDAQGQVVGFCKQKAFRIREDLRIFTDDTCSKQLLQITTRSIWDISGVYTVLDETGQPIGALKRQGLKSLFFRDSWEILGPEQKLIGTIQEDSGFLAILRRLHEIFGVLFPQKYNVSDAAGNQIARYRQHFNPFVYRLGVALHNPGGAGVNDGPDELILLAAACVIAAIEGRQSSG